MFQYLKNVFLSGRNDCFSGGLNFVIIFFRSSCMLVIDFTISWLLKYVVQL